jgi:hypothetical protein
VSFGSESVGSSNLASDAEREHVAVVLRDAAGEGRITSDELDDRLGLAYAARTAGQLEALTNDLPVAVTQTSSSSVGPARTSRFALAVMGGAKRRGRWRLDGQFFAISVMGGCTLDLRQAEIVGDNAGINLVTVMGGCEIIVSEGVDVQLSGISVMGGKRADIADVPIRPGTPAIQVRAVSVMGSVKVRSAPPPEPSRRSLSRG